MWGYAPIVVPIATAFVLAGDCGGGAGFVIWNSDTAGTQGGWIGYVQTPAGMSAYRLAPIPGRSSLVLEHRATEPGGGSWVPVTCHASPFAGCPGEDELPMPEGWSLSCERQAGQVGICVCDRQ